MVDYRLQEISDIEAYVRSLRDKKLERLDNFERTGVNMKDMNDVEFFALVQAVGLVDAIQRGVLTTCLSKQSVFSVRVIKEFRDMGMEPKILGLLLDGMELKDDCGKLTPEVVEKSDKVRDKALEALKDVIARRRDCQNSVRYAELNNR